jgi:hypothetical protein
MFICFLLIGAAYRHQFVYIYPTKPDSGGKLWVQFMKLVPACMLIGEVTIVGFLVLKMTPLAVSLMIPLLIMTILFTIYLNQKHFLMTQFLPARVAMDADYHNNHGRILDLSSFKNKYVQPEMLEKKVYPSNASLERQMAQERILEQRNQDAAVNSNQNDDGMIGGYSGLATMTSSHDGSFGSNPGVNMYNV